MKEFTPLKFTFEEAKRERQEGRGVNIDVYMAAGVSTEIDCELGFGPPAGPVYPNAFGLQCLSVRMLNSINHLIEKKQFEKIWTLIRNAREEEAELSGQIVQNSQSQNRHQYD
ncbi:MAG: hypothetical protein VX278_06330 [Myxococcota bacterium]|nr:hypothetical protein [Myxococcota bacterium]